MKPRYGIGETVRIKATGEKVKIVEILPVTDGYWYWTEDDRSFFEPNLKPFRPSRTGKFRNSKGQFISFYGIGEKQLKRKLQKDISKALEKAAQEQRDHFSYEESDSKQRNYQKITPEDLKGEYNFITPKDVFDILDRIEKKIDELGRKV